MTSLMVNGPRYLSASLRLGRSCHVLGRKHDLVAYLETHAVMLPVVVFLMCLRGLVESVLQFRPFFLHCFDLSRGRVIPL